MSADREETGPPRGGGDPDELGLSLDDPAVLRALAHPTRLALLELLIVHGPLTASEAGRLLGLQPNAVSFHLRQLASHGFVAEAPGGTGRRRPWKLTRVSFRVPDGAVGSELDAAATAFSGVTVARRLAELQEWFERRGSETPEWREAGGFGYSILFLEAAELTELRHRVDREVLAYLDRVDPANRPPGSRPVSIQLYAFPLETEPS